MRIRTDGKFAYREALVDDVAEQLGENTRVGAVEASCEFTQAMLPALAKAGEHPRHDRGNIFSSAWRKTKGGLYPGWDGSTG
jgi:hypothetical protein